jgi:hypothetical protein
MATLPSRIFSYYRNSLKRYDLKTIPQSKPAKGLQNILPDFTLAHQTILSKI